MHGGLGLLFWDFGSSSAVRSRASFEILLLDVLGLGSLHQKHPDAMFSGRCKSRQVQYYQTGFFWTFRRLPSRCRGSLFPPLLLRRFSVLLPHQADFDFVHSTVVAKRSHFAEVLSLVTVFWSLFLLMERDELCVSPSPHRMSRDSPLKGGLATPTAMSYGPLLPSELTSASFPTTTSLAYFQSRL